LVSTRGSSLTYSTTNLLTKMRAASLLLLLCSITVPYGSSEILDDEMGPLDTESLDFTDEIIFNDTSNSSTNGNNVFQGEMLYYGNRSMDDNGTSSFHGKRSARSADVKKELAIKEKALQDVIAQKDEANVNKTNAENVKNEASNALDHAKAHASVVDKALAKAKETKENATRDYSTLDGNNKTAWIDFDAAYAYHKLKQEEVDAILNGEVPIAEDELAESVEVFELADESYKNASEAHNQKKKEQAEMESWQAANVSSKASAEAAVQADETLIAEYNLAINNYTNKHQFYKNRATALSKTDSLQKVLEGANKTFIEKKQRNTRLYINAIIAKTVQENFRGLTIEEALVEWKKKLGEDEKKQKELVESYTNNVNAINDTQTGNSTNATSEAQTDPSKKLPKPSPKKAVTTEDIQKANQTVERSSQVVNALEELKELQVKGKLDEIMKPKNRNELLKNVTREFRSAESEFGIAERAFKANLQTITTANTNLEGVDINKMKTANDDAITNTPLANTRITDARKLISQYIKNIENAPAKIEQIKEEVAIALEYENGNFTARDVAEASRDTANSTLIDTIVRANVMSDGELSRAETSMKETKGKYERADKVADAANTALTEATRKLEQAEKNKEDADNDVLLKTDNLAKAATLVKECEDTLLAVFLAKEKAETELKEAKVNVETFNAEVARKVQEDRERSAMLTKLGIGLGVAIAVLVLLIGGLVGAYFFFKRKREKEEAKPKRREVKLSNGLVKIIYPDGEEKVVIKGSQFRDMGPMHRKDATLFKNDTPRNTDGDVSVIPDVVFDESQNEFYGIGEGVETFEVDNNQSNSWIQKGLFPKEMQLKSEDDSFKNFKEGSARSPDDKKDAKKDGNKDLVETTAKSKKEKKSSSSHDSKGSSASSQASSEGNDKANDKTKTKSKDKPKEKSNPFLKEGAKLKKDSKNKKK
ncbi:hypothetical protein PFISCL1PPCAC_25494, partial [Pristionchus fissidentatus]